MHTGDVELSFCHKPLAVEMSCYVTIQSHITWQLETEFIDGISKRSEGDYADRQQIEHGD